MRALFLLALLASCASPEPKSTGIALAPEALRADVELLASDDFLGRGTGEKGADLAAEHLATAFAEAGLEPLPGAEAHELPYTLYRQGWDRAGTSLKLTIPNGERTGTLGGDFRPFPFSDAGTVSGELVFAGYGITNPELDWDDYADLDVTGKIVVLLRHDPGEGKTESPWSGHGGHALFTAKARNAFDHGAAGMILVTDPLNHEGADDLRAEGRLTLDPPKLPESREGEESERTFVAVHVAGSLAEAAVAATGKDLAELQTALNAGEPVTTALDGSATLTVTAQPEPEAIEPVNVVGFLEGSDPELKDEWVVIGAHYDHLGAFSGDGDTVFNGADDNASGTAGLLALARAFGARQDDKPSKRSIVFAAFSGEEKGLLGSRSMVRDTLPVDDVAFMLNLDMIGRTDNDVVEATGDGYATGLTELVTAANEGLDLPLELGGTTYSGNSDHHPFYEEDVPFLFLHTGLHDDYHQLSDHTDKLDVDQMAKIVTLGFRIADGVASGEVTPRFVHHVTWLGVTVELREVEGEGLRAVVTAVEPDSRATEAGFEVGDALYSFDEAVLVDAETVGQRFRTLEPGATSRITVDRANSRLTFDVERAKTGYLGVWPANLTDEIRSEYGLAEDEGLVLRQVMEETPAAAAGLKDGDLLIRIKGVPVGLRTLSKTLTRIGAGETVPVTVIRDGERVEMPLTLGERPERP